MDPIKGIAEQVKKIAETAAKRTGLTVGTVISRNSDGSVNVDTGDGGCVRVERITNQPTQCGSQVVLGLEPSVGQTLTVCPTTVTVASSTKPCPTDDRTDDNEEETEVLVVVNFIDDAGNTYDETGALTGTGGDTADIDNSFGYSYDGGTGECKVGASPSYDDLVIGDTDTDAGNQGSNYSSLSTRLALNTISNVLMGAELKNSGGGGTDDNWKLVLRDPLTYALIDEVEPAFVNDWMAAHPVTQEDAPNTWALHIVPDPSDGHFWVVPQQVTDPPDSSPNTKEIWKVSSTDLSLLATVTLQVPNGFRRRAEGVIA